MQKIRSCRNFCIFAGIMSVILAIESSCDETSAAVLKDGKVISNIISSQLEHADYGGVIPELASRLHQQQIIRVVQKALRTAETELSELDAIGFTRGPGLMGALMVGTCFSKALALGLGIPLIDINHMQAHVLANFLAPEPPKLPFLCLTVSGGHTQIVWVRDYLDMEIVGHSIDDAAGEAFDKAAKILGLPYPGGPEIDKLASQGNPEAIAFPKPDIPELNYSFSGLKTSLLYTLRKEIKSDPDFVKGHLADICASYQDRIVSYLLDNFEKAADKYGIKELAIAGGVSANSQLREDFKALCDRRGWKAHIPDFQYCTDNAGMIGIAAHFKFLAGQFADQTVTPFARERDLD